MSILNYLPTFKVVEMNRSTGLVTGHVLSQFEAGIIATKAVDGTLGFIENGIIVGLSNDLTVENYDPEAHSMPFIVFVEELNTFMSGLKYFATPVEADATYPRAIGLFVGDVWTTNNFTGTGTGGVYATGDKFAEVVNGKIKLQQEATTTTIFAVEESTLPTGEEAVRVTYIGKPVVVA